MGAVATQVCVCTITNVTTRIDTLVRTRSIADRSHVLPGLGCCDPDHGTMTLCEVVDLVELVGEMLPLNRLAHPGREDAMTPDRGGQMLCLPADQISGFELEDLKMATHLKIDYVEFSQHELRPDQTVLCESVWLGVYRLRLAICGV